MIKSMKKVLSFEKRNIKTILKESAIRRGVVSTSNHESASSQPRVKPFFSFFLILSRKKYRRTKYIMNIGDFLHLFISVLWKVIVMIVVVFFMK